MDPAVGLLLGTGATLRNNTNPSHRRSSHSSQNLLG